jgi:hypothetical protein
LDYASDSENIYEEIKDDSNKTSDAANNGGCSSGSGSGAGGGSDGLKGLIQRARDTVARRSSRQHHADNLSSGGEQLSAFHMSISKGRKKTLIDRAAFGWDCGEGVEGGGGEEEEEVGDERREEEGERINQHKLDSEVRKLLEKYLLFLLSCIHNEMHIVCTSRCFAQHFQFHIFE